MSSATFHHPPHTRTSSTQGFANFLDVVKLGSQTDWYRLSHCTSTRMVVPIEPRLHTYPGQLVNLRVNQHPISLPTRMDGMCGLWTGSIFLALAYQGKDIVFRFSIEYISLRDFGP